jgi:hypothetical protein
VATEVKTRKRGRESATDMVRSLGLVLLIVSDYTDDVLRVGWVTPKGEYAEYAASAHPGSAFVSDLTGRAPRVGSIDIAGVGWEEYRQDQAISLVRTYGPTTVILGTLRDTASLDELRVLAGRLSR